VDLGGEVAPDVSQVPGFELVAAAVPGVGRIAENEPVLMGVRGDPLPGGRVGEGGGELAGLRVKDVDRGPELVLAVAGSGDGGDRLGLAYPCDFVLEQALLVAVAAVGGTITMGVPLASAAWRRAARSGITNLRTRSSWANPAAVTSTRSGGTNSGGRLRLVSTTIVA
jgi:hypothetical protein